jgi:hypothetical protein
MDGPEFIRQIGRSWEFFKQLTLDRTLIWKASLPVDEDFRRVALAPESFYAEIYRVGLSRSSYNFLLSDYSYFQFSWDSDAAWRLAYFPNPWIAGVPDAQDTLDQWEALEEMGGLSHEDASDLIEELPYKGASRQSGLNTLGSSIGKLFILPLIFISGEMPTIVGRAPCYSALMHSQY